MKGFKNIYLFGLLLTLISCSPKMRLERIVRNHPEVVLNIQSDTLVAITYDTFKVQIQSIDTVLYFKDSVQIKDSIYTITVYKNVDGGLRIKSDYKPIKVPLMQKAIIITRHRNIAIAPHPIDKWKYRKQGALLLLILQVVLVSLYFLIKQYIKKIIPV